VPPSGYVKDTPPLHPKNGATICMAVQNENFPIKYHTSSLLFVYQTLYTKFITILKKISVIIFLLVLVKWAKKHRI